MGKLQKRGKFMKFRVISFILFGKINRVNLTNFSIVYTDYKYVWKAQHTMWSHTKNIHDVWRPKWHNMYLCMIFKKT